jgi:hypothetical protein
MRLTPHPPLRSAAPTWAMQHYLRLMKDARLSHRSAGVPLSEYDAALMSRLSTRLLTTLTDTLHQSPTTADELARQVRWSVESDDRGLWMTMTLPDGTFKAVGGEWPQEPDSLLWYVDDLAYGLAGQGGAPCHDGE